MRDPGKAETFASIVGRKEEVAYLQDAIRENKISHAYIFGGEKGSGKRMLASIFAMTLECEKHETEPCQVCSSCKRFLSGNHPDIRYVTHEKSNSIGIDEIRSQLVDDVEIRPYDCRYKIYIVDEAQKMTVQAQNALLKTIEEPPEYAVIILLAENPDAMLPTVLSRCVRLDLKPVSEGEIKEFLMTQMHVPDYQAEVEATFAQGNIGTAKKIAESRDFIELTDRAIYLLKRSRDMSIADMLEELHSFSEEKRNIYEYLDIFEMWFRDVLTFKATRDADSLIFQNEVHAIIDRAEVSSYEGLEKIIQAIGTARTRLKANVNFDLTLELMMMTMKEN
ncbi:MAG: DNA polymerase III subunit delta' [Eubacterium sp.]|nr:DNA polymerase III subunit delta' [Eubacterium sp.]